MMGGAAPTQFMAGDWVTVEEMDAFSLLWSRLDVSPGGGDLINLHGASTALHTSCQGLQSISQNSDLTKHCSVSAQSNIDFLKGNHTSKELKQIKKQERLKELLT